MKKSIISRVLARLCVGLYIRSDPLHPRATRFGYICIHILPFIIKKHGNKTYMIYQLCYQIFHNVFKNLNYILYIIRNNTIISITSMGYLLPLYTLFRRTSKI